MDEWDEYQRLKTKLHRKVLDRLDLQKLAGASSSTAQDEVLLLIRSLIAAEAVPLSAAEKERLAQEIRDEIFGLGPLEPLLNSRVYSQSKWHIGQGWKRSTGTS